MKSNLFITFSLLAFFTLICTISTIVLIVSGETITGDILTQEGTADYVVAACAQTILFLLLSMMCYAINMSDKGKHISSVYKREGFSDYIADRGL